MSEMKQLHFSIAGEFITNVAREKLFVDKDLGAAIKILRGATLCDKLSSDEQLMVVLQILHGAASIVGTSGEEDYGLEVREDIEERPTDLSSISQLIKDLDLENKRLRKENQALSEKFCFLAEHMSDYKLRDLNTAYYRETGEPMFSDMDVDRAPMNNLLKSFLAQRRREEKAAIESDEEVCDYGWLEPDGTWHPVEWGEHYKWASEWLKENKPYKEFPHLYWRTDVQEKRHHIDGGDVLIYSLGWVLLDSPHQGLAQMTRDTAKELTKSQKEFLFDYFMERDRMEEANKLYKD